MFYSPIRRAGQLAAASFLLIFNSAISGTPSTKLSEAVSFEENKGQVMKQFRKARPDVLFSGTSEGMTFHISCSLKN
jgi:hypothetical protein